MPPGSEGAEVLARGDRLGKLLGAVAAEVVPEGFGDPTGGIRVVEVSGKRFMGVISGRLGTPEASDSAFAIRSIASSTFLRTPSSTRIHVVDEAVFDGYHVHPDILNLVGRIGGPYWVKTRDYFELSLPVSGFFRVLHIGVKGVPVTGEHGEVHNVALGNGASPRDLSLAHLHLLERLSYHSVLLQTQAPARCPGRTFGRVPEDHHQHWGFYQSYWSLLWFYCPFGSGGLFLWLLFLVRALEGLGGHVDRDEGYDAEPYHVQRDRPVATGPRQKRHGDQR